MRHLRSLPRVSGERVITKRLYSTRTAVTSFTEDETLLRSSVSRFAKEVVEPQAAKMDKASLLDKDILQQCFDNGFMGIEVPTEYGGNGMTFTSSIIVIEELAKIDPAVSVVVDVQNTLVGIPIRKWGSPEQKAKYLPKICSNTLGSFCLSEWTSGSDAFAMKTTATKVDKGYILNGSKAWITNSYEAGLYIVFANADTSKGYKGISAFIVSRDNPGIKIGKKEDKLGIRASSTCEVLFDNCFVPQEDVLGEIGKGYKYAIESLNEGRIGIAAQMIGLAQGALDYTIPYTLQRKQFGQPVGEFQGVRFDYADCATDVEAARVLTYNAARLQEEGKPFVKEAAMAKLFSSRVAEKVSSKCIEMLGGVGFTKDFPVEKLFRDSKIGQIYEGTTNIQLETIGKLVAKEYQ